MHYTPKTNLTIVPARAGSKRVPGKNKRSLAGVPLIAWTLHRALNSPCLGDVMVTTDDPDIAAIADQWDVPYVRMRPSELASDVSHSKDVIIDALAEYQRLTGKQPLWMTLLQPTSPFRSEDNIASAFDLFQASAGDTVVSVAPQQVPLSWMVSLDSNSTLQETAVTKAGIADEPLHYYSGSVYHFSTQTLAETGDLYTPSVRGAIVGSLIESVDIDTPEQWALAECLAASLTPPPFPSR